MNNLITKIIVRGKYKSSENIIVDFEIENNTSEDLYVLSWNTPLEGIVSDCFNILGKRHGKIEYDGKMIKRRAPTFIDFILIQKGESKNSEINLSEAYDLSGEDEYIIEFNSENLVVIKGYINISADLKAIEKSSSILDNILNIVSSFVVKKVGGRKLTIGQEHRVTNKKKENELSLDSIKEPKYEGGTQVQKDKTKLAHSNGYKYASDAVSSLKNDNSYLKWFGLHTNERFKKVKDVYSKVKERMETTEFTYNLKGDGCTSNAFAWTTKGSATIWLCDLFWDASDLGIDSKAGTIVHEHSHASANTDDVDNGAYYGVEKAKKLAKDNPDKAIKNADNFEYFAESET